MDELLKENPEGLPLHERARWRCLPDELSLVQIAELSYPGDPDKQRAMAERLWKATREGPHIRLGPVQMYSKPSSHANAHDRAFGHPDPNPPLPFHSFGTSKSSPTDPDPEGEAFRQAGLAFIEKADYRRWLEAKGWPLPDWWFPPDDAEPPAPAGPNSSDKPAIRPRKPLRNSDPATVIDAALDALEQQNGRTPKFSEVWPYLLAGRGIASIVTAIEHGELVFYNGRRMDREKARKAYNARFQ